jgi:hypothetical protein
MTTSEQPANAGKMKLEEYAQGLGHDEYWLCHYAGVNKGVLLNIREGKPIAASVARKIARYLSERYEQQIGIEDISDVKILQTGKEHTEGKRV